MARPIPREAPVTRAVMVREEPEGFMPQFIENALGSEAERGARMKGSAWRDP